MKELCQVPGNERPVPILETVAGRSATHANTTVAFDARHITSEPSGIGQMCLELLRGLVALDEPMGFLVLLRPNTRLPDDLRDRPNLIPCSVPWKPFSLANQIFLPRLLRQHKVHLLHSVDSHNPLLALGLPMIVNIHDLIPLTCEPSLTRSKKARYRRAWWFWLKFQCLRARRIVSGSRYAARDIVRLLRVDAKKVVVIPDPIRHWNRVESPEQLRERLGLSGPIISYVGRQEPYKNVVTLIRSLPLLNAMLPERRVNLVIAGPRDDRYMEARREADRLGLEGRIHFPGYLSEPSLGALYQLSDVFVFPSLHEGFGMPPLEAMQFGTPVVTGRHTALPEVLGDAAFYVDTTDPRALARGIAAVLQDAHLVRRLRQSGLERVRLYSSLRAARIYFNLYREVLQETTEPRISVEAFRVDALGRRITS